MTIIAALLSLLVFSPAASAEQNVSPSLFFARNAPKAAGTAKIAANRSSRAVVIHLDETAAAGTIADLESHGVTFSRFNGDILHAGTLYPASLDLDSLDVAAAHPSVARISDSYRPALTSPLDVSAPQVQAADVWELPYTPALDGSGVIVADVDTGVDIYHPAFFKADGGTFSWIDVNTNGAFDSGTDAVDLDSDGVADSGETLRFYDALYALITDSIPRTAGVYDADLDWLYNDANGNGARDYGSSAGYGETDPSFGERMFIINDTNGSNRLDPGETLTGLGTSKIVAVFDGNGTHLRGANLMTSTGDAQNHGTGACGIVGGQHPGRRFTGMAPGVEFISINRLYFSDSGLETAILSAKEMGADIFMFEFGGWVYNFLDGTDDIDLIIDDLHDAGVHTFAASGNLAGPTRKKHAFMSFSSNETKTLPVTIFSSTTGVTEVYVSFLWRNSTSVPTITLNLPSGTAAPISMDGKYCDYVSGTDTTTVASGYDASTSGTRRVDVYMTSTAAITGSFSFTIKNGSSSRTMHAYVADNVTGWMYGAQFSDSTLVSDNGTICMPATAVHDVTVGAYDPRGTRNPPAGSINDFSSWGNTIDGRRGVDITAPGWNVYSLYASTNSTVPPGTYLEFNGTSAALPHVVGCAALLLQASPSLTPDQLDSALCKNALVDDFTGSVPNNLWGYGKLRILDAFNGLGLVPASVADEKPGAFTVSNPYPNPFNGTVSFSIGATSAAAPVTVTIYNLLGQTVFSRTLPSGASSFIWTGHSLNGAAVSSGIYFARFRCGTSSAVRTMSYLK